MNLKVFESLTDICWWEGIAGEGQVGGREHTGPLGRARDACGRGPSTVPVQPQPALPSEQRRTRTNRVPIMMLSTRTCVGEMVRHWALVSESVIQVHPCASCCCLPL